MRTVRDAAFDVLRRFGGTTLFSNPGSTEISLLTDLPEDLKFVLALHEGSVVGMATGWAIANQAPAVVILHTTAGLGNAVGALATARVNKAPLVVLVGQQDRRHLAMNPFLAGHRLDELAGDYPVWVNEPARPQDVPGALARAWHEATEHRGPAIVIVPMDDWDAPADGDDAVAAPARVVRATGVDTAAVDELVTFLDGATAPVIVVGAGTDDEQSWAALQSLAGRLQGPVWQEAFGARAGYPQDDPYFAGHLPSGRSDLRKVLAEHDVILAVGAPVFRQYPHEAGPLVEPGTRIAIITDDPAEANGSPADLAVVAPPAAVCALLAERLTARPAPAEQIRPAVEHPGRPVGDGAMQAPQVFAALADRIPRNTVIVEESPSSRASLHALLPAREPLGFLSAAMGGLGFGRPASIGVKLAQPDRPVVAVVGDGSSMYAIQALWSAARYRTGVLVVVMSNGRYAIMDRLARMHGETTPDGRGSAPWPSFEDLRVSRIADGLGCPARRIETYDELITALDEIVPTLSERHEPLVLDVAVQ
ncbi:thiamine pyrophosphate-dependent enzyme [Nakamurella sp.]|uniref:thiamine pyrophosphate-dependent enzyme n=1 Tax=Nakamurella sp. TaxID=1869182 RepID=UPI003B3B84A3